MASLAGTQREGVTRPSFGRCDCTDCRAEPDLDVDGFFRRVVVYFDLDASEAARERSPQAPRRRSIRHIR